MLTRGSVRLAAVLVVGAVSASLGATVAADAPAALERQAEAIRCELEVGSAKTLATVAAVVELTGSSNQTLLPKGVVVDRAVWVGNVLHVELTLPGTAIEWRTDPLGPDRIHDALARPFKTDANFGGTVVMARRAGATDYVPLADFATYRQNPTLDAAPSPDIVSAATSAISPPSAAQPRSLRGAVGQQPVGALTGVVVYTSAGHGWTAGDASWYLQRPLFLDMIEDYGNIDQLNYFVNYLYRAGATIVPFRPVGYQSNEIVLDQDDPEVSYTGSWTSSTGSPYYENGRTTSGDSYKYSSASATESATARYTPNIPASDFYPVYTWALHADNRTTQLYRVVHSGGTTEVVIDHRMVGSGWVWLGNYYFEAGTAGYVEISNESTAGGVATADAIRFGNGMGDLIGSGPGTVSGYPREEECSRYWAESEAWENADGLPDSIFDCCEEDQDDNVGTAARWAAQMNRQTTNNDRWRRAYFEFHTNAAGCAEPPCSAKGTVALVSSSYATTNQVQYSTIVGDEIETDMRILDSAFEFEWGLRSNPISGGYGAISTYNNDNEFDATLLEVAFHDNEEDTANLLNPYVRDAVARSSVHGLVKFLSNTSVFPATTVPQAFLPTEPRDVRAVRNIAGDIVVSWTTPVSGEAYGDPATGYRVYRSPNGYGFDGGEDVGNVLTTTLTDIPLDTTTYLRVVAYNAGGESAPSEVLAVRRATAPPFKYLIVNGFDTISAEQNHIQTIPAGSFQRQIIRKVNSRDYVVQHATALTGATVGSIESCSNESIIDSDVSLQDYDIVLWICGEETAENETLGTVERNRITEFLELGGALLISGSDLAYDLDALDNGRPFYENTLGADYVRDSSGTHDVEGVTGTIFEGLGGFDFDPSNGATYDADRTDEISPTAGSDAVIDYVGGTGGTAGVMHEQPGGLYRVVTLGFPFETVSTSADRADMMQVVVDYLEGTIGPLPFDGDHDGDVDLTDFKWLLFCAYTTGPDVPFPPGDFCLDYDGDGDFDVDMHDYYLLQQVFTGELK